MSVSNRISRPNAPSDDRKEYRLAFRKQVFQLLKWGYDRLEALNYRQSEEEAISGDLAEKIEEIIQNRELPGWVGRYSVHVEKPVNTVERKGKRRQRLDMEFERVRHGPRPRYIFEAKLLCKNTHATMGAYFGPQGLGEFLSGNYASESDEAGMLGYVQSDTPRVWAQKATSKFENDPKPIGVRPGGTWSDTVILPDLDHCYRSKHDRLEEGGPITIYHLFLVFC